MCCYPGTTLSELGQDADLTVHPLTPSLVEAAAAATDWLFGAELSYAVK